MLANGANCQFVQKGKTSLSQKAKLVWPKGATNNNNLIRPINKNIEQVSKARSSGADLSPEPLKSSKPLNPISKKENIFTRLTNMYGEERTRDALRIIDEYVDKCYPAVRNQLHPHITTFSV